MLGKLRGWTRSISRFWGTSPNILGGGKDELMRRAERYQTPGSKRGHKLAERWDSINSVRAGTHSLPDFPI